MPPLAPEDVLKPQGGDNFAGLKRFAYYALLDDVATMPAYDAETNFASKVSVSADVVFNSTKCFKRLQLEIRNSTFETKSAGERGSKSSENTVMLYHSRVSASMLGFLEENKNNDLVLVIEELDGTARLLGSADLPATIEEFEVVNGADVSDEKAVKVTISYVGKIAPVYTGAINLTPAA